MAFKFTSEPQEFYTAYRNGVNFDQNMSEFTYRLRGNVGDLVQVRQTVTVEVAINESQSLSFDYDSSTGKLTSEGIDFRKEGLTIGTTVQVIQGRGSGEATVENITGRGFNTLFLTTTNLAFLTTGNHSDIYIRLKDAPTYVRYEYGVIPDDIRTESDNLFNSPIDGNAQAYYKSDLIAPSVELFDMIRFGPFQSWDLTTSIQVAYLGTTDDYYHEYQIIHTFKICGYIDGEQDNVINEVPPAYLAKTKTLKYANKIALGYSSDVIGSIVDLGVTGDVGYYGENYNGKRNIYTIDTISINGVENGTLGDPSEENAIELKITNSGTAFTTDQKIIVTVFKMSVTTEYTNKKSETADEVFISEQLVQEAGVGAVDGTIIKNLLVTYNANNDLDVEFDVEFSVAQQENIKDGDLYTVVFSTGDNTKGPDDEDNVSLSHTFEFDFLKQERGLIYAVEFNYYDSWGVNGYTNRSLWNGDFTRYEIPFRLAQTSETEFNQITKLESRVVIINDSDEDDYYILWQKDLPLSPVAPFNSLISGGYIYQIANGFSNDTTDLPTDEPVNVNEVISLPSFPAGYQEFEINGTIPRIPWREWIEELDLPAVFFDAGEENNNLNQRASNYSGINGYSVYHEVFAVVEHTKLVSVSSLGGVVKLKPQTTSTEYHLRSDAFEVIDFDLDGNPSISVSGEVFILDAVGTETDIISATAPRLIKVDITHDLGTLNINDLWAEIWIERTGATGEVAGQLHSDKNWANSTNPLTGSQEVGPSNLDYVEIVSELGKVYLYCLTNPENIISGTSYNVYYRLGKKTV